MPLPTSLRTPIAPEPPIVPEPAPLDKKKLGRPTTNCVVCPHEQRAKIEALYADNRSVRWISDWLLKNQYVHVREKAIQNHFEKCLGGTVNRSEGLSRSANTLLQKLESLADRMNKYLDELEKEEYVCAACNGGFPKGKDWRGAAGLAREYRQTLELWGKILGHVRPDMEINIMTNPQFTAIINPICQITAGCARCAPLVDAAIDGE